MARTVAKPDAQIKRDVVTELQWDTRVDQTDVGVEVDDGIVTLTGTVPHYAASVAAVEAAHVVAGVLDVVNNITIRASGRPVEADLAMAVRQSLEGGVFIPSNAIRTTVAHGVVTLTGEVEYWAQREAAEHAVQRLAGVLGIVNRLTVRKRAVSAEEVQRTIEDALARLAEAEAHGIGPAGRTKSHNNLS